MRNSPQSNRNPRRDQGFTLVEIMVVVLIIGMLAAIVGPAVLSRQADAQIETTKTQIAQIQSAAQTYMLKNASRVPTMEDLTTEDEEGHAYLTLSFDAEEPMDPWDNPYVIEELGGIKFDVRSFGPDGEDGTEDDISFRGNRDR